MDLITVAVPRSDRGCDLGSDCDGCGSWIRLAVAVLGCDATAVFVGKQPLYHPMSSQDPDASELPLSRSGGKRLALCLDSEACKDVMQYDLDSMD